jgi:hypothetical protein
MEVFWNILTFVMIIGVVVALLTPILGVFAWIRRASGKHQTPKGVIYSWRDDNGQLRWALSTPEGKIDDLGTDLKKVGILIQSGRARFIAGHDGEMDATRLALRNLRNE